MITASTGLTLNHGRIEGYRFMGLPPGVDRMAPERADNRGRVLLFVIDGVVEFIDIVYFPLAEMLLNGTITDMGNLTIEVTANGTTETVVFEQEDEDHYAILVSNPTIIESYEGCTTNCLQVHFPGWKWNGEIFYQ